MRDLYNKLKVVKSIGCAALDADNTPVVIDRQGYESLVYELNVGIGGITFSGANKIEFKLYHSDKETAPAFPGDFTAVTAEDVQLADGVTVGAGGIVKALTAAHAAASVTKVGYIGNKRWTALLADFTGTHGSPTPVAANAILSDPHRLSAVDE